MFDIGDRCDYSSPNIRHSEYDVGAQRRVKTRRISAQQVAKSQTIQLEQNRGGKGCGHRQRLGDVHRQEERWRLTTRHSGPWNLAEK